VSKQRVLAAVRAICLGLPETSERLSHGAPTFFVREKRSFATVWDDHHGDGRFALICAAPEGLQAALVETERVLASVIEAVIGACYLHAGYERTADAVVDAFGPEIEGALEHPVDFKSALQELLARRGAEVSYVVTSEQGPPHERTYAVVARVDGRELGSGSGRSKKHAEQAAAQVAVGKLQRP